MAESPGKPSVWFVRVHNAGRSQMAAAWPAHLAGDRVEVRSAGSNPGDLDGKLEDPAGQGVAAVRPIRDETKTLVEDLIAEIAPQVFWAGGRRLAADVGRPVGCMVVQGRPDAPGGRGVVREPGGLPGGPPRLTAGPRRRLGALRRGSRPFGLACGVGAEGHRRGQCVVRVRADALRGLGLRHDRPAAVIIGPSPSG